MPCSARHCLPLLALLLWAASAQAFVYTKPPTTTQCRQVVASGVNIRFAPSLSAATEGEALRKCDRVHYTGVKVTADGLDWAQIKWMGADRYVAAKYLVRTCAPRMCEGGGPRKHHRLRRALPAFISAPTDRAAFPPLRMHAGLLPSHGLRHGTHGTGSWTCMHARLACMPCASGRHIVSPFTLPCFAAGECCSLLQVPHGQDLPAGHP